MPLEKLMIVLRFTFYSLGGHGAAPCGRRAAASRRSA